MTYEEANEWVQTNVAVHMIIADEDDPDEETTGWVHTHGMDARGLPELEIRGVRPAFLMVNAGELLNKIAAYMVASGNVIKAGENMAMDRQGHQVVRFHAAVPMASPHAVDHYDVLRLTITGEGGRCVCCEALGAAADA